MADRKIGIQITLIKQHLGRLLDKMLTEQGIHEFNGPQGRILYVLWNHDFISIQELAKGTGLANTTLTSMLDRMEQKQLIRRTADINDRRKYLIALTPKARSLEKKYRTVTALETPSMAVLSRVLSQTMFKTESLLFCVRFCRMVRLEPDAIPVFFIELVVVNVVEGGELVENPEKLWCGAGLSVSTGL